MESKPLGPVMMDIEGVELTGEDRELLQHPLVGGLILFSRNYRHRDQLRQLIRGIRDCRPGILIAADYEGGRVQRFREEFTVIPAMRELGEAYDRNATRGRALAQACGWLMATELCEVGVDLNFAPVVDIDDGVSEVIGDRAFHHDPEVVAELATALMTGMREAGMSATAKHFPGHGHVAPDSHTELPIDERTLEEIEDRDLQPFMALMEADLSSVMMAHILYPAVDDKPASLSHYWISQYLRRECGFDGAIFCDDLSMGGAAAYGSYLDRAQMALQAGCDMLPICNHRPGVVEVLDGLRNESGDVSEARLNRLRIQEPGTPQDFSRYQAAQSLLATLNIA